MVIQMGARRNYVYARQLHEAGLLHSLVCDAAWAGEAPPPLLALAGLLAPHRRGALARRRVHALPPDRLRSSLAPVLVQPLMRLMSVERGYAFQDDVLGAQVTDRDLSSVRAIVNYQGNGGRLLARAKRRGVRVATDFIITPRQWEIEAGERLRWPGWETGRLRPEMVTFYRQRMESLLEVSDIYLCPSATVARDLSGLRNFHAERVRTLPYGPSMVDIVEAKPVAGRILFTGAAGLRKGLPYLAEAAAILRRTAPDISIVVAGHAPAQVRNRPETAALTFLGHLDRAAMAGEFARADVFCLPSLAEGSPTSIFEALAQGLPVVTTAAAGSVVEHGIDGLIVPERDSAAIAHAVSTIVSDRKLRTQMSAAARSKAKNYSDDLVGARFISTMRELLAQG